MSGDYSRIAFDPRNNYATVLLEQGRPLTDRDWNELALGAARRDQVTTLDVHGPAYLSAVSAAAFNISRTAAGEFLIGPGRLYLDGLLVENHGAGALRWDSALGAQVGSDPTPFKTQPYRFSVETAPAANRPFAIYLDAWPREVTQYIDPGLIESALGIDTTTRLQTVWQVKFLDLGVAVAPDVDITTVAKWRETIAPSGGRLSVKTANVPQAFTDSTLVPPAGGYRGLENHLYRIEIYDGGTLGSATFKWSRENASVQARVTKIIDAAHIVVDSIGKDELLRFANGDWIEVTDDAFELAGLPGQMTQIKIDGGVDERTRVITIDPPLAANAFPTNAQGEPNRERHMRIRRWEQKNRVLTSTGALVVDLSAAGARGTIPVKGQGIAIHLEDGIVATFSLPDSATVFKSGDYWTFAARANDASVETFDNQPPRGIHHHFALLAMFKPGDTAVTDRRPATTSLLGLSQRVTAVETKVVDVPGLKTTVATLQTTTNGLTNSFNTLNTATTNLTTRVANAEKSIDSAAPLGLKQRLDAAELLIKKALAPRITDGTTQINPNSGPPGVAGIKIFGRNFLAGAPEQLVVKFGPQALATITTRRDTFVEVKVPTTVTVGSILTVTVGNEFGEAPTTEKFTVTPPT